MMGFQSFVTAEKTIAGLEIMHMIGRGHVQEKWSALFERDFINNIMGLSA